MATKKTAAQGDTAAVDTATPSATEAAINDTTAQFEAAANNVKAVGVDKPVAEAPAEETTPATNTADTTTETTTETTEQKNPFATALLNTDQAAATTQRIVTRAQQSVQPVKIDPVDHVDKTYQENLINEMTASMEDRATRQIDNGVQTGVRDLQRTEEDAQDQFQTQRNQIDIAEQRALDNQVLYNQSRGDNGGIGLAQYNSIQNTAAVNRLSVNKEQTKLSTDVQRQIADLRAQGEFDKADKLLEIAQTKLSELASLDRWAQETNLGVDEFNAQLKEWEASYALQVSEYMTSTELNAAEMTGAFADGSTTYAAQKDARDRLVAMAEALLSAGIEPTAEMLAAMGLGSDMDNATLNAYLDKMIPGRNGGGASGGGGGGSGYFLSGTAKADGWGGTDSAGHFNGTYNNPWSQAPYNKY